MRVRPSSITRARLCCTCRGGSRRQAPTFSAAAARGGDRDSKQIARTRIRPLHQLCDAARRPAVRRDVAAVSILVQGTAAADDPPRAVPLDAECGAAGNVEFLAGVLSWARRSAASSSTNCRSPRRRPDNTARIESINCQRRDAFAEYQVPLAILALQQGLGRLIRHRTDRGVLAILDPRLRTMGYGRRFLESLPPAPVTQDLAAVERFFV